MNNMKKLLILATVLLLFANISYAASFDVKVTPINDKIVVDEVAEFNISIQNNLNTDEEFTIKKTYINYPYWDMFTKPLQNPITLRVPASSSASIPLFVNPVYKNLISVDTHTLGVGVALERTGEEQKAPVTISIKSTEPLISGYIPTVLATVDIPEKIDPRENVQIRIALSNQNVINYTNLTINVNSRLFKDELHVPLGPKEDKTVEITKKLDDMDAPQDDKISVTVLKEDRLIVSTMPKDFKVAEYSIKEVIPEEKSFLKIKKGIRIKSNNLDYKTTIKVETTSFKNLFLTSSPRADAIEENGKRYLVWQVRLDANREASVYTFENYRPLVLIFILTIMAVLIYFLFRGPIVVRKSIANVVVSEGGISEAKVVIRVKNRSSKQLTNIEVLDNVPHIAHVEKELSIGSMQPHAILQHPKKGMMIKWIIESLEAGDERVLSYKLKSRLPILGEFSLSAASARCSVGSKLVIGHSNTVTVGG